MYYSQTILCGPLQAEYSQSKNKNDYYVLICYCVNHSQDNF